MIDSLRRHLDDFERGHDFDDAEGGSDLPHVSMIMASAMMLTASVVRGIGEDDRMPCTAPEAMTGKEAALWIQEQLTNSTINNK